MKYTLFVIFTLILLSACNKSEKTDPIEESKSETLKAIIGTWTFTSVGYSPNEIISIPVNDEDKNRTITFNKDYVCITGSGESQVNVKFEIKCNDKIDEHGNYISNKYNIISGINGKIMVNHTGETENETTLYHYSDSTLMFEYNDSGYLTYSQLRRK